MNHWSGCASKLNITIILFRKFTCLPSGLVPEEDAPDILANTFLAEITERQLDDVHVGFLGHREREFGILYSYFTS